MTFGELQIGDMFEGPEARWVKTKDDRAIIVVGERCVVGWEERFDAGREIVPLFVASEQNNLLRLWEIAIKWLTLYERARDALVTIGTPEALEAVREAEALARKEEGGRE